LLAAFKLYEAAESVRMRFYKELRSAKGRAKVAKIEHDEGESYSRSLREKVFYQIQNDILNGSINRETVLLKKSFVMSLVSADSCERSDKTA